MTKLIESPVSRPRLAFFKVNRLHGDTNIRIDFQSDTKILIADNGKGKTSVLKLLVGVLTGRISRLSAFEFESLEIAFRQDGGEISSELITATELVLLATEADLTQSPRLETVRRIVGQRDFDDLIDAALRASALTDLRINSTFIRADTYYTGTTLEFAEELRRVSGGLRLSDPEKQRRGELRQFIDSNFPYRVVYWTTYRRIEDELEGASTDERSSLRSSRSRSDALMNFGMQDVEERIRSFTDAIRKSTLRQYQTTNAKMLNTLALDEVPSKGIIREKLARKMDLELVLSRLKTEILEKAREQIMSLVASGEIFSEERNTLAFLLSNLISIYDDTKQGDEQIKAFVMVANKYLNDKYWLYDDISVSLQLRSTYKHRTGDIRLARLSSGEKQLVSILARLYLPEADERDIAVIIDEPELSLSLEWQRMLIPDIMASGRCKFLIAATHSPFIFDNDLEAFVSPLDVEIVEPAKEN